MRHAFQDLPGVPGPARPVVDVTFLDFPARGRTCLLDTGAAEIRMSAEIAESAGIELTDDLLTIIQVGGYTLNARGETVGLSVRTVDGPHEWAPTVYFCESWPFSFGGLLGLGGLHPFVITVCPYEEWSEIAALPL